MPERLHLLSDEEIAPEESRANLLWLVKRLEQSEYKQGQMRGQIKRLQRMLRAKQRKRSGKHKRR